MRKLLMVGGAIVGVVFLAIIAIFTYAYFNLSSIIASNRGYILAHASDAVGRPVQIQDIKATIGWGVKLDVSGVKVADDPAFSQLPFLQARDVYVNVQLLPLLARSLKVSRLIVQQPQLRVIRDRAGVLNVATIGSEAAGNKTAPKPPSPPSEKQKNAAGLAALTVGSLRIQNGSLSYQDQQAGGPPVQVNDFNFAVDNFSVDAPFDVAMSLAALGQRQDVSLSGKVGPLTRAGKIQTSAVPLNLDATIGPISLAQLQSLPQLAHAIPATVSSSQPITIYSKITGTSDAPNVDANGDLTASHLVYDGMLDKPANVPLKFTGSISRAGDVMRVNRANLVLATLRARAGNVVLEHGNLSAQLDTNNFDVAGVSKVLTLTQKYNASGNAEVHARVQLTNHHPSATGTMALTKINATLPGAATPPLSDLTGTIRMAGNGAIVGPLTFNLGANPATLQAAAQSLQPLRATYQFNATAVNIGDLVASRKPLNEHVERLAANGNLGRGAVGLSATTNLASASGMVANVPYQNLALAAVYDRGHLSINSLRVNTFDGTVGASGVANMTGDRNFNLKLTASNVDVQKALAAQKSKAADTLRGILTGNVQVAGAGSSFDQIKPTLHGIGGANLKNGKLVGINVVGQALQKVNNLPAIGRLVPESVAARHPELFRSNDTDIQNANLTFTLQGPRLTTHDLNIAAADYTVAGDGWFDMDKNVELAARILMSKEFSSELISAKRDIAYVTNPDGRVEIPLRVVGQLPKPAVLPDVNVLAQRAATNAAQGQIGRLLGKKGGGLGGFFGGGGGGGAGGKNPSQQPTPSNPLNQFKGLFR